MHSSFLPRCALLLHRALLWDVRSGRDTAEPPEQGREQRLLPGPGGHQQPVAHVCPFFLVTLLYSSFVTFIKVK
ncbi:Feline leukemia virus subgroup C receptor-related protein 1 [Manis javanica]|nr:Feline leukemia virus subgroup C receptor-related protein 1 [Manis javanica]